MIDAEYRRTLQVLLVGFALIGGTAFADDPQLPAGVTIQRAPVGAVLANANGMTAYVFDKDVAPGKSACNGNCAKAWPPLAPPADATPLADWTVIDREDGTKQWAYKGKPLYTFNQWDTKPGDIRGNNVGGIWHVATP